MKNDFNRGAQRPLNRSGYAKRTLACVAALFGWGFVLGIGFSSTMQSDPLTALQQMYPLIIAGNIVAGIFFVQATFRRALDTRFAENGFGWFAVIAALPTLALPQYGLLVFIVMMLLKSAPAEEEPDSEDDEFEDDEFPLPPLQAGE